MESLELDKRKLTVGQDEHPLNRNTIGAGFFTVSRTAAADIGSGTGNSIVSGHGFFFPSLGQKIVIEAHDGVDRNTLGTMDFTHTTGVPAVQLAAALSVG